MKKLELSTLASCVIIYQASCPSSAFFEIKPDNYHIPAFQRHLCLFGGNWGRVGETLDRGPRHTVLRELDEELKMTHPTAPEKKPRELRIVQNAILYALTPFGDFLITVPTAVFKKDNPETLLTGRTSVSSTWTAGLPDLEWYLLVGLQNTFHNLCNEGISVCTSLHEILSLQIPFAWGCDQIMREFWSGKGLQEAESLPIFSDISVNRIREAPLPSYDDYLDRYEILQQR